MTTSSFIGLRFSDAPVNFGYNPDMKDAREGVHNGATELKFVKSAPSFARESMFGVLTLTPSPKMSGSDKKGSDRTDW